MDFVSNDVLQARMGQPLLSVSVDGACLSLAIFVVPTQVKTILELDAESVDQDKPG